MLYPIAIERGDDTHAFGVVVPGLPGCFSAGDTFAEAVANAREAIEAHLGWILDENDVLPAPTRVEDHIDDPDFAGWIWSAVDIPAEALDSTVERVNISAPRRALRAIDAAAERAHKTRSAYLIEAALQVSASEREEFAVE